MASLHKIQQLLMAEQRHNWVTICTDSLQQAEADQDLITYILHAVGGMSMGTKVKQSGNLHSESQNHHITETSTTEQIKHEKYVHSFFWLTRFCEL